MKYNIYIQHSMCVQSCPNIYIKHSKMVKIMDSRIRWVEAMLMGIFTNTVCI